MRTALLSLLASLALVHCGTGGTSIHPSLVQERAGSYANPMRIAVPNGGTAESCPDPSIIRGQDPGDTNWYLYCTSEMFTDHSRLHFMSISKSTDPVNWTYVGDVFPNKPRWVAGDGYLWAPDIQYFNGKYHIYCAVSNTRTGGATIFVATSNTPIGPYGVPRRFRLSNRNPCPVAACARQSIPQSSRTAIKSTSSMEASTAGSQRVHSRPMG